MSLFTGIFAVFVLTMVYANVNSIKRQSGENPSGQVEMPDQLAEVNPVGESAIDVKPDVVAEQQDASTKSDMADAKEVELPENAEVAMEEDPGEGVDLASGPELESEYGEALMVEETGNADALPDTAPVAAVSEKQNILQNLHFQEENGILWPAEGAIIKNYSVEKLIYFDTLEQYKCNPAVMISLAPGSDVLCGAKGVVTAITETEELGQCMLVDIGDGYQLKYAQLADLHYQVGDVVEEGAVLAQVAEPTIYYTKEGSNLYFQVLQNGETVNPLLLLR